MEAILGAKDLKRIINATRRFVGNCSDAHRAIYQFIRLDFSKEFSSVTAVAVDGFRMSIEHAVCRSVDEDFTVYVKGDIPKSSKYDLCTVWKQADYCYLRVNDMVIGNKQPSGEFLDYNATLQNSTSNPPSFRISVNGDYMLTALQAAKISCGDIFKTPVVIGFMIS